MGLFQKLFGNKQKESNTRYKMITDDGGGFYSWDGNLYKSDLIRAAIRPKAQAIGKLVGKHILNHNKTFKVNPKAPIRFLLEEPNPFMTGQMLQEKLTTQLMLNNNAFAYINRDEIGNPVEIYPLNAHLVEEIEGKYGDLYLRFTFKNGKRTTIPYVDIIHLRRDFYENDLFGDSPYDALKGLMEIVNTTDQGIVKAIKNSTVIKWIMKFKSVLRPEDRDLAVDDFIKSFLSIDKGKGVAATDTRYDLEQIKQESYVPNAAQMKESTLRLYSFFNTNTKIIQSEFTEDGWNSYFESEIEPLAKQLSNEYTRRLFTRNERSFGNSIVFEASSLQYATMKTKLALVAMVDRGSLTPNEWREILNLAPIEGGDKPIRRLDTALANEPKADNKTLKGGEDEDDKQNED